MIEDGESNALLNASVTQPWLSSLNIQQAVIMDHSTASITNGDFLLLKCRSF